MTSQTRNWAAYHWLRHTRGQVSSALCTTKENLGDFPPNFALIRVLTHGQLQTPGLPLAFLVPATETFAVPGALANRVYFSCTHSRSFKIHSFMSLCFDISGPRPPQGCATEGLRRLGLLRCLHAMGKFWFSPYKFLCDGLTVVTTVCIVRLQNTEAD